MSNEQEREYEEGAQGTEIDRKDDSLKTYRKNEPMAPAKIQEHEPTAVKRDSSDQKIVDEAHVGTNPEEAGRIARTKGSAKGEAGAAPTGTDYEQGSAGSNR